MRTPRIRLAALVAAFFALASAAGCDSSEQSGPPERGEPDTEVSGDAAPDTDEPADTDPADTEPTDAGADTAVETDAPPADVPEQDTSDDVPADTEAPDTVDEDTTVDTVADTAEPPETTWTGPLPGPEPEVVRLLLMGDTGEGNPAQYQVSASAQRHCDLRGGCAGFLMLGDNIYDVGPESPTDPLFDSVIDLPYANLKFGPPPAEGEEDTRPRMPILVSLGNHDLGGAGLDTALARHYLDYALAHDWFYFPSRTWQARLGPVHVVALDTNPLAYLGTETDEQGTLIERAFASTGARWKLVFGHHPYRSDGGHGNAGSYEGIPGDLVFLGGAFRQFVDDYICNDVDFYISGHDHNRQWMRSVPRIPTWPIFPPPAVTYPCDTRFSVSGAGAKTDDMVDRDNDLAFGDPDEGFLFMEFTEDYVLAEFCDIDGVVQWSQRFE